MSSVTELAAIPTDVVQWPCARSGSDDEASLRFSDPMRPPSFHHFARLPTEIRHEIWESTLAVSGMHFLKINAAEGVDTWRSWIKTWDAADMEVPDDFHNTTAGDLEDEDDEIVRETRREIPPGAAVSAKLEPLYPTPKADISYYTTLNKQLAKLSVTCTEALTVAQKQTSKRSVLKLDNGRIISLDCASDVIYLEYVPPEYFEGTCCFTKNLICPGLDKIRRVAMRYCHKWHATYAVLRCPECGLVHGGSDTLPYPKHLYQFIARCLPNLEYFYFVDYLILRKTDDEREDHTRTNLNKKDQPKNWFQGGNRTYYEVDEEEWNVTSKVSHMASWLQDRFVRYAQTSKFSKHKTPEGVKFGVLACEWTVQPPEDNKLAPIAASKKGRNKRPFCEDNTMRRNRRVSYRKTLSSSPATSPQAQISSTALFVFGAPEGNTFEFTFTPASE